MRVVTIYVIEMIICSFCDTHWDIHRGELHLVELSKVSAGHGCCFSSTLLPFPTRAMRRIVWMDVKFRNQTEDLNHLRIYVLYYLGTLETCDGAGVDFDYGF